MDSLPSNVGLHHLSCFSYEDGLRRRLSGIAARQAKHFLQKDRIALASPFAKPQIMQNNTTDYSFI